MSTVFVVNRFSNMTQNPKMFMANCSKFNEWYHRKCVTTLENIFENSKLNWVCPHCLFGIALMSETFMVRIFIAISICND